MKKLIIGLLILGSNLIFTSCTDTSLADTQDAMKDRIIAGDSGGVPIDPPDDPPGGLN